MQNELTIKAKTEEELFRTLAELGGELIADDDVVFEGKRFILPHGLTMKEAAVFLIQKMDSEDQKVEYSRTFNYRPWDGARCTDLAVRKTFGMFIQRQGGMWSSPPQLITIPNSVDSVVEVPWGQLNIPSMPETVLTLSQTRHPELGLLFKIEAYGPKKDRFKIQGLFEVIEHELRTNSMYRGKAFDGQEKPEFLDLSGIDEKKVVYSEEVMTQLDASVWSLLKFTEKMRETGLPLKRSVLFEGTYGTGKTLGAFLTAKYAIENSWTFIYCRPGRDNLLETLRTAKLYQPAVVFMEDVDIIAESGGSQDHVAQMLDAFDGISSKNTEILCVLTTNHRENIHKGMLRPGRLDAVISIGSLDTAGVERLVKATIKGNIEEEVDWEVIGTEMAGFVPAYVKEAADRAVRYTMSRGGGEIGMVTQDDLVHAARGLRPQLELMEAATDKKVTGDTLEGLIGSIVEEIIDEKVGDTVNSVVDSLLDNAVYSIKESIDDTVTGSIRNSFTNVELEDNDGQTVEVAQFVA